jgi:hypothetical protein
MLASTSFHLTSLRTTPLLHLWARLGQADLGWQHLRQPVDGKNERSKENSFGWSSVGRAGICPCKLHTQRKCGMCTGGIHGTDSVQIWQLSLTQGLIYGIGTSMLYFPVLAVAPEYCDAHRGSAMDSMLSAAGLGGLAYAPATRPLLAKFGVRWTFRILGIVNFAIAVPTAFNTPPSRSITNRPTLVNLSLAKKPAFILQAVAAMAQATRNFVPLTPLPDFSTRLGYAAAFGAVGRIHS